MIARNDKELFQRAFTFVQDPQRLLQNGFMRDPLLAEAKPDSDVTSYMRKCSVGWLMHCGAHQYGEMVRIFDRACMLLGWDDGLAGYNDSVAHADVVALWRAVGQERGWL